MRSTWIDHKGKKSSYCDYAGLKANVAAQQAESDAVGVELMRPPAGSVLELAAKDWLVADQ